MRTSRALHCERRSGGRPPRLGYAPLWRSTFPSRRDYDGLQLLVEDGSAGRHHRGNRGAPPGPGLRSQFRRGSRGRPDHGRGGRPRSRGDGRIQRPGVRPDRRHGGGPRPGGGNPWGRQHRFGFPHGGPDGLRPGHQRAGACCGVYSLAGGGRLHPGHRHHYFPPAGSFWPRARRASPATTSSSQPSRAPRAPPFPPLPRPWPWWLGSRPIMLIAPKLHKALPASLIAVLLVTVAAELLQLDIPRIGAHAPFPAGAPGAVA